MPEIQNVRNDIGLASASTLGSLLAILGDPAQTFLTMLGYEGATALANKLTAARAALIDQITAARMGQLDPANIPATLTVIIAYIDELEARLTAARAAYLDELAAANIPTDLTVITAYVDELETRLTALRAGYLDNINQAGLLQITAARAGYLDNINNAQLLQITALRLGYIDLLATLTAARIGYLDNINNAGLLQLTVARAGYLDELAAANIPTDLTVITAYVDELETRLTALRAGYLDNINQAGLLQVTAARAGYLDALIPTAVGKLQVKATTIDLNQAANTYVLFTANTQDVVVEKLVIRMSGGALAAPFTFLSIQTDDATPIVLISAAQGAVANLTNEAQLAWTGAILLDAGTAATIGLTIAVAFGGAARVCDVIAEYRAVVAGGLLV